MIIVDTSALIAVMLGEPEKGKFIETISGADIIRVGSATLLESRMVLTGRKGRDAVQDLDDFIQESGMEIMPVTATDVDLAFEAFLRYGKGSGSGAKLNFGDCFSYALAKRMNAPLLFKGNDFSQTDISTP